MKRLLFIGYILILLLMTIFSWGFVDANFPVKFLPAFNALIFSHRDISTAIYTSLEIALFIFYGFFVRLASKKKTDPTFVKTLIILTIIILFFSWPAFAYDIFNYIATAKLTFFYHENPYLVMPIEIPNEPLLTFMHASNKVALYGFVWILITAVPWFLGASNLLLTVFTFKALEVVFYLVSLILLWKLSNKDQKALAFFGLNPLVTNETLISAHNDIVMMALTLASFYFFQKKRSWLAVFLLFLSIFIKFATLALIPVFIYLFYLQHKGLKINWDKVWKWSAILMYVPFFLSPLREEIYSWYLIWPLTFTALALREELLAWITAGFSFGLPLRLAPFLFTGSWGGETPLIKKIITSVPPIITAGFYELRKKI